jgi:hypothetical protein
MSPLRLILEPLARFILQVRARDPVEDGLDRLELETFRHRRGDPFNQTIFASIYSGSKSCHFGLGFIMQLGRLAVSRDPALDDRTLELFEHVQKARNVVG